MISLPFLRPKDKMLGVAQNKQRYDLPLHQDAGGYFLILLICLMSFLGCITMAGAFILSSVSDRWQSGLENALTIEIPAQQNGSNKLRDSKEISILNDRAKEALEKNSGIENVNILSEDDIKTLISPWLGEDAIGQDLPLPGLLSVTLKTGQVVDAVLPDLKKDLSKIAENIRIDTHESWLSDILKLTSILQFLSGFLAILIGTIAIVSISGAIRAKMAIHHQEIELLHLMGARDRYVARQFQRHMLKLSFKGCALGVFIAALLFLALKLFFGKETALFLPNFNVKPSHMISFMLIPVLGCFIAAFTARYTVLRALRKMP